MSHDVSPYLTVPGTAFNCTELQQQFFGMSARDVYALLCKRSGCEPVSSVLHMLPDKSGVWDTVELDLSRTYIGHRGVVPLTELCKLLHKLKSLNLSNNFLTNKSVWHVCKMATFHPSIASIDLSRNDVSWTAGMCVLELVMRNPAVQTINVADTLIKPAVAEGIVAQIRRNGSTLHRKHGGDAIHTTHPMAIRLRALKRLFREACAREQSDAVPKSFLVDGYKETMRLSGREKEFEQKSPAVLATFVARAPTDRVPWEHFMLLVMNDEITINQPLIEKLRAAFRKHDTDRSGVVELSALREIMEAVNEAPVADVEVESKLAFYSADSTMTLSWDEFLLMMYDRGPVVGEKMPVLSATPLVHLKSVHR